MVADLVGNLLGPRGGREEEMEESPVFEYVTGILAPIEGVGKESNGGGGDDPSTEEAESGGGGGTYEGDERGIEGETAAAPAAPASLPALDPKRMPPSMGMTFYVQADGAPEIDVCVTWARYTRQDKKWRRTPRHAILSTGCAGDEVRWLDGDGSEAKNSSGAEVSVHMRPRAEDGHVSVSIHVVNRMGAGGSAAESVKFHVFQPQIRVLCGSGTRLVPQPGARTGSDAEETEQEMLYRDKRALGKGHLTSVVWKEIDPECLRGESEPGNPECLRRPGFSWVDGRGLPDVDRERFSKADIRTEFVPMYAVPAPDADYWPGGPGGKPRLGARFYSDLFDPDGLRGALAPLAEAYEKWAGGLEREAEREGSGEIARETIKKAKEVKRRIGIGIDLLCSDDDARLAFCFACRAMDMQVSWSKGPDGFAFRPFQLAFVLLSAESALNPKSTDRGTCDLLWVPTGAGKTEAYLVLAAMVAAYRRLKARRKLTKDRSGVGVSVISRYTLRLLTIQQFRRTLALFTAMECLRVDGMGAAGEGKKIGWRPSGCGRDEEFLWGTARFSVGLWAGTGVTPNWLEDRGFNQSTKKGIPGALTLLRDPDRQSAGHDGSHGEPAQVLDCPACGTILSLPTGGLRRGSATLHYAVRVADSTAAAAAESVPDGDSVEVDSQDVRDVRVTMRRVRERVFTMTISLEIKARLDHRALREVCEKARLHLRGLHVNIEYLSARSRPGYFFKRYGGGKEYDFEVFCPSGACPLRREWAAGTARGNANGALDDGRPAASQVRGADSPDGNLFVDVNEAFRIERHVSDRVPIPAFMVDEQVYAHIPTMIVGTVDKFARMPFESRSAQLFGNVDHCHHVRGYYRLVGSEHPGPTGTKKSGRHYERLERGIEPPNLIIQDELHLLDGPLGSMVGIYETAVDRLASGKTSPVKYVASTATTRRADQHVRALFSRDLAVFPPQGIRAGDRPFIGEPGGTTPLDESGPGRLYVGVWAPGRGPLTPLVRIWSRLACSINCNAGDPSAGKYWTITGYFSSVRELAEARSLYRQNIPERAHDLSCGDGPRTFGEDTALELSGRTPSADLPAHLRLLEGGERDVAPEALFTTSMFGTGIDVSRISTMVVAGQPKTQSAYIQATGRVGRTRGAIVVMLHKPGRPRDLNHYELFARYHMQLHRFVEPPTAFPFAAGVMEHAAGPVMVGMLRNMRGLGAWAPNDGGALEAKAGQGDMDAVGAMLSGRAAAQPERKRPDPAYVSKVAGRGADRWRAAAGRFAGLAYYEYAWKDEPKKHVVLGSPAHKKADRSGVFEDVPNSMRSVEEEAVFEA